MEVAELTVMVARMDKFSVSIGPKQARHIGETLGLRLVRKVEVAHIGLAFTPEGIDQMLFSHPFHKHTSLWYVRCVSAPENILHFILANPDRGMPSIFPAYELSMGQKHCIALFFDFRSNLIL